MLEQAEPYRNDIKGIGLAGAEQGFPPSMFTEVFKIAKEKYGYLLTVHAGEEGDPCNIREAIEDLKCDRVDHGATAINDPSVCQ